MLTQRSTARTLVATLASAPKTKVNKVRATGADILFVKSDNGRVSLRDLMGQLGRMGIMSVLIEGGAEINASALKAGIVDKIIAIIAPTLMTGRDSLCSIGGISPARLSQAVPISGVSTRVIDRDLIVEGYVKKKAGGKAGSGSINSPR